MKVEQCSIAKENTSGRTSSVIHRYFVSCSLIDTPDDHYSVIEFTETVSGSIQGETATVPTVFVIND